MVEIDLSQSDADRLIGIEKHRANGDKHDYPYAGKKVSISLVSVDRRENFTLDIHRGRIDLSKGTYQTRGRQVIVLVRLDFCGAPHRNPDGQEIPCPHIHIYREGYGDKWAQAVSTTDFANIDDAWATLGDFMRYCNITQPPNIERGLFT